VEKGRKGARSGRDRKEIEGRGRKEWRGKGGLCSPCKNSRCMVVQRLERHSCIATEKSNEHELHSGKQGSSLVFNVKVLTMTKLLYRTKTTTTILRPFFQDNPRESITEKKTRHFLILMDS